MQPSVRHTVATDPSDGAPIPSASAKQPISEPPARRGSQRRFCAASPNSSTACAARYALDANGIAARLRPTSSAITHSPSSPNPMPPYSSGMAAPSQPSPATLSHSARSNPLCASSARLAEPAALARRNACAWLRTSPSSCEKSKFTQALRLVQPID